MRKNLSRRGLFRAVSQAVLLGGAAVAVPEAVAAADNNADDAPAQGMCGCGLCRDMRAAVAENWDDWGGGLATGRPRLSAQGESWSINPDYFNGSQDDGQAHIRLIQGEVFLLECGQPGEDPFILCHRTWPLCGCGDTPADAERDLLARARIIAPCYLEVPPDRLTSETRRLRVFLSGLPA